ncbi:hypothetical protein [Actinomyces sp. Marseille-P3109]|nr:hypothetical protein [Actinomyces sp. Marseille-P3109]
MRVLIIRDRFNHFWHCGAAGAAPAREAIPVPLPGRVPDHALGRVKA